MDFLKNNARFRPPIPSIVFFVLLAIFSFQTCSVLIRPFDENRIYIWKDGDRLDRVAAKYSIDPIELKKSNEIYDEQDIRPGAPLVIPGDFAPSPEERRRFDSRKPSPLPYKTDKFTWPADGSISSKYGPRGKRMHYGIDIRANHGRNIYAVQDGVIDFSGFRSSFGRIVVIKHGSRYLSLYAHNSKNYVKKGDKVKKGQKIARMGATGRVTGVHLHFELHENDKPINPIVVLPKSRKRL